MGAGRPATRLAQLDPEELALLHQTFGTCTHAYRCLMLSPIVKVDNFRRLWDGVPVTDKVVAVTRTGWDVWAENVVEQRRSRRTA